MTGDVRDVLRAPAAWAMKSGLSGSHGVLWMMFVLVVGVVAGLFQLLDDPSIPNMMFAAGCLLGALAIEAWLVRWYRRAPDE